MKGVPIAVALALLVSGCSTVTPTPIVQVVYITSTPLPTSTAAPTNTPTPTKVLPPTAVPAPTQPPITLAAVESALTDAGYARGPFYDERGESSFAWTLDNPYEQFITWSNGTIRLEVLNQKSTRLDRMERKLKVLDQVFPVAFMTKLRQENDGYHASAGSSVSGKPDMLFPPLPDDPWNSIWGQYNTKTVAIGPYDVTFALWFFQITCPPQYSYCYMTNFPGQEFSGDSSFVFYTIEIPLSSYSSSGGYSS